MKESTFVKAFKDAADSIFNGTLVVSDKANLLYELFLNEKLELAVKNLKEPKRGFSAFQTDICVYEKVNGVLIPRIAIEFKTKITTHDILTYSAKAGKHKSIYPSLRYGLIASEINVIPTRFFIHNEHIDFFVAALNFKTNNLNAFIQKLVEDEVKAAKSLEQLYLNDVGFNYYRSMFQITNFSI